MHTIAVTDLEIVELTSESAVESIGLDDDDWTACQIIGDAVDTLCLGGLTLSATGIGIGNVLTVYVRHAQTAQLTVVKPVEVTEAFSRQHPPQRRPQTEPRVVRCHTLFTIAI